MTKKQVAIVGTGELGSRYLQGLAAYPEALSIIAVDPVERALSRARERWEDMGSIGSLHKIYWASSLHELPEKIDLVIVATGADARASVVATLSRKAVVKYWVLEKVLAQSGRQLLSIRESVEGALQCWVNTPRRMMTWYCCIKEALADKKPLHINRIGGLWGLACNSIHFIDLTAWLTGESLVSIDTSELDNTWFGSKRSGFYEISGRLEAKFSGGTILELEANHAKEGDSVLIVETERDIWYINESNGTASNSYGDTIFGELEYQSNMTSRLVSEIFDKGSCGLPCLDESLHAHEKFLSALLAHWNRTNITNDEILPIT